MSYENMGKTILVGITAGIAGYKILELIKLLKKEGFDIFVVMTEHSRQMFSAKDFEKASGNKVYSELFPKNLDYRTVLDKRKVDHIELADHAHVMVIVPATANMIAKLAHGIADDFLTTTALAFAKPILVCPAMNVNMWQNPIVKENITKLKSYGMQIIEPASGMLACGYEGQGRLENIQTIYDEIIKRLKTVDSLKGKKIIVTSGGTTEKIDEVRNITNRSSGKMGVAIAEECYLRGADVLLLRAKNSIKTRYRINERLFTTADELYDLIKNHVRDYDVIFHVAAVSDFKVAKPKTGKISSNKSFNLKFVQQIKILNAIKKLSASWRTKIKLIAFKAEYNLPEKELIDVSYQKLKESQADAIIANDISRSDTGFEADTNEVYIVLPNKKVHKIPLSLKKNIANKIIDYLCGEKN